MNMIKLWAMKEIEILLWWANKNEQFWYLWKVSHLSMTTLYLSIRTISQRECVGYNIFYHSCGGLYPSPCHSLFRVKHSCLILPYTTNPHVNAKALNCNHRMFVNLMLSCLFRVLFWKLVLWNLVCVCLNITIFIFPL